MRSTVLLGALLCVLTNHAAYSGDQNHFVDANKMVKPIPPGLAKVMAEGAGRVANMTCADVRAVVAIYGEWKAEATARAAGATDQQIKDAKRCLKSSSR